MSNFLLNRISLLVSRRPDAAPAGATTAQPASHLPAANDHPGPSDAAAGNAVARAPIGAQLPLVPYPMLRDEVAPPATRPSRALNLQRSTTSVALTSRLLPTTPSRGVRAHESHQGRPVLTKIERVRLQVMQIQLRLASLSLYDGPIDGVMTPETATGVRYFQTLKGLHDTGVLAPGTLKALGVPPIE